MKTNFPDRLQELLRENKTSQRQLALKIGVTSATVSAWCRGLKQPTADNIAAVARIFGVSADYLLGLSDY